MATEPKSTVRGRKKSSLSSTQRFLPVAEIRDNTILLKNGGLRAVLEVEALNFNLKSETEQQGIISGYGSFVNSLNFPVQIVIRSSKTNIDDYIGQIRRAGEGQKNELLKKQIESYTAFMQKLVEVADIMQKRFYIVVPVDHSTRKKTMLEKFFEFLSPDDSLSKAATRNREFPPLVKELNERVELVNSGLSNIGLHAKRLQTRDCIELLYQAYNAKTSQTQKIPAEDGVLNLEKTTL